MNYSAAPKEFVGQAEGYLGHAPMSRFLGFRSSRDSKDGIFIGHP